MDLIVSDVEIAVSLEDTRVALRGFLVEPDQPSLADDHLHIVTNIDAYGDALYADREASVYEPLATAGARSGTTPFAITGATLSGFRGTGFEGDWYDRIHIYANPLNLGNLTSAQSRDFYVWNARDLYNDLTSITPADDDGLALTEPSAAPTTFGRYEERLYSITPSLDGPAVIDANYIFDFDTEDPVLSVVGVRVIGWPLGPDWRPGIRERLEWLTDVMVARDGTEQRVRLRDYPRRSLEYSVLATDAAQALDALVWGLQDRLVAVPLWWDAQRVTTGVSAGAMSLTVTTTGRDYQAGGLVALGDGQAAQELMEIDTVNVGSLDLVRPVVSSWPAGTIVAPARYARLEPVQSVAHWLPEAHTATLRFRLQDASDATAADSGTTYRSYPVVALTANWATDPVDEYARDIDEHDPVTALAGAFEARALLPRLTRTHLHTLASRAEVTSFRAWLYARSGRLKPCWLCSGLSDLVPTRTIGSTDLSVWVAGTGHARYVGLPAGRRDIQIRHRDGTVWRRRITARVIDGSEERLALDSALGATVQPADLVISWLVPCRLGSDAVELLWWTTDIAECQLAYAGTTDDL